MGGDGQALMNKRKHLLQHFQSGSKRTQREGEEDPNTAVNPGAWTLCTHSGELLCSPSLTTGGIKKGIPMTGREGAEGFPILADFLGNLYRKDKVLETLIEKAKAGALPAAGNAKPSELPSSSVSAQSIQKMEHIRKFKEDMAQVSADYSLSSSEPSLRITCALSSAEAGVPATASTTFLLLWNCGHVFSAKALLAHWDRVVSTSLSADNDEKPSKGTTLSCPTCDTSVLASCGDIGKTVVNTATAPRLITSSEWSAVMELSKETQNGPAERWFEHNVFHLPNKKGYTGKPRRGLVPLVQSLQQQKQWI